MPAALIIVGTIFGLISGGLFAYGHDSLALVTLSIAVGFLLYALIEHLKIRGSHLKERKTLLNSALEIIDARTRLTVDLVGKFRADCKKYRYALPEEQRVYISHLLSAIGDVRINDTELSSDTLTDEERKMFISENRAHLNKIEKSRSVIESFLNKTT